ncbi:MULTISPECIES: (2Fe-2S) ferredoxin domain-containing protein [unclassified Streptomyces]|uniref:(2Fe-2S) ferredoxin domain-containing protein n=1 Tax=unclassified Streptomyces TaxID=2593676 RepID=UPI002DD81465|nr:MULTISPECIES: (2Fe-2S) ferredoxin domain-containing protein [unclassified Streptomyces]WSA91354.1 (2Fe-2S) ferredoxin domain-containing protein [Streptomyces sp. NBC_01795]WSB75678.1 (2Fe-2S) ferredoxin domain-containing protein [Streptomyces sp. NBC_01775]WSS16037.1 (2Fe-2S) ferredoxin domain-containing protein [Streptomyces sp. NBC_01186]WSS44857.1 (2Fe-2S) ferredoxin domain-containing protein [Streptomyces sp. NBC_01187]
MSKRQHQPAAPAGAAPARCTVTVCRGCCCGSPKIPGLDHAAQLRELRRVVDGRAAVRVTDCLDACAHANVIVVQPSAEGRRAGGRPVWLGLANDADVPADVATWVEDGGPGLSDPPDVLGLYVFSPSRRVRAELDG